ncbi:MAG: HAMP domain-containing histidine kinase, partial [Muribaculaceae bacterium]|nr:HAMP domain-containing histidine kinase [Muribaculaceae bacterium]
YENANHALNIIRENRSRTTLEELDRKIGNLELTIENQKLQHENSVITSIVLSVIFLIVLVALYFVLKLWNQAKKAGEELKVKNQELEQARDEAVRSEQMKTIFIQNISHEIRTPLNAIVGFSDVLATQTVELEESERMEFLELIKHNNDHLTKLITDILTLSDLDSGKNEIEYSEVKVNKLCRNVLQSVKHRVQNNVILNFNTEVSDLLEIETDDIRLTQVLNNLLVNACKYTTDGSITLECKLKGEQIEFAVRDTGPGIPPEHHLDIFERFTKLDNFHQGTGIGLNICRTLVEMMHGKIYVDDRYVNGSRFVVLLPVYH